MPWQIYNPRDGPIYAYEYFLPTRLNMQARNPMPVATIYLPDFLLTRSTLLEHSSRLMIEQQPQHLQLEDEDLVRTYMQWIGEYFLSASRPSQGPLDWHRHRVHDYLSIRLERLQNNLHGSLGYWWNNFTSHCAIPDPPNGSEDIADMFAAQMLNAQAPDSDPNLIMAPEGSDDQVT